MIRIDTVDGLFREGNPATGVRGTKLTAVWLNALQEEVIGGGGDINTYAVETTLDEADGVVFVSAGAALHLPAYTTVSAKKRFVVKNIGEETITINCADGKTIDGESSITLNTIGDRCTIVKDGTNWQTI